MGVTSVAPEPYLCAQVYGGHTWHSIPNILDDFQIRPFCFLLNMEEKATWPSAWELKGQSRSGATDSAVL